MKSSSTSPKRSTRIKVAIVCKMDLPIKFKTISLIHIKYFLNFQENSNADITSTKITCIIDVMAIKPIKRFIYKAFQTQEGIDSISIQECLE